MNGINVYETPGGWVYEVRFMGCLTVIGCCATLAAATLQASLMGEDPIQLAVTVVLPTADPAGTPAAGY